MTDLTIRLPEVPPLGWEMTRLTVDDMWNLFVAPSIHEDGFLTPELRALAALLRSVWQALPDDPEPRRWKPTIERTEA